MFPSRVLVTGGAKRIGRSIVEAFAARGSAVVIHYNTSRLEAEELLASLPSPCAGRHELVQGDLRELSRLAEMMGKVLSGGCLDLLVNNASSYHRRQLGASDPASVAEDYSVNFQACFELMRLYHESSSRGQIINMLDYRVEMSDPNSGSYGLAKKSLKDATEAAAVAWAPSFRVNGIAPGIVLPPAGVPFERMSRLVSRIPTGQRTTEAEIGSAAVFLASTECMNGQILYVDGGLHLLGADATGEKIC